MPEGGKAHEEAEGPEVQRWNENEDHEESDGDDLLTL